MLDLIIFIVSVGPRSGLNTLIDAIVSLNNTIGNVKYKYYLVLSKNQEKIVTNKIKTGEIDGENILEIKGPSGSWAEQFNTFFSNYKDSTKYIMISHDDLVVRTKDFFSTTINLIDGKEKEIGWITYTNDFHYTDLGKPISASVRPGFFKDREHNWPRLFECHKFEVRHNNETKNYLHLVDMPEPNKIVKAHAPYSDIAIISTDAMNKIGPCEDWTPYTMLIDEDWGLEALRNNLWNVWISNIYYTHPTNFTTRTHAHRYTDEAHEKFTKKWGFTHGKNIPETVRIIRERYKNTLIPWSSYFNSYDWQYLE